ncbi:hypothetical protein N9Y54_02795 [Alphaproteobacteria bacterium]|nr:hypothetical protein [Alphaproteobacteria bacterium]
MLHALSSFNIIDLLVLLLSLTFISLLFFAGRSVAGSKQLQSVQIPIGMFLIYIFYIIGTIIKPNFSITNVVFFLIILSIIGIWRSKDTISNDLIILLIAFTFVSPLLIFGVLSHDYLWDDYTNWMPPARYLYKNHHLPTLDAPIINHSTSSYSYLRALIHSMINLPLSEFVMNIQNVFNICFGSTILLWAKPITKIINNENKIKITETVTVMGSFLCFLIIIWIVILSKLLISGYSEATYLVCLLHLYFYFVIQFKSNSNFQKDKFDYVLAILLTIPFMIKDIGFYHSIILFFSYLLVFEFPNIIINKNNSFQKIYRLILIISHLIPLFLTKFLWSYYVTTSQLYKPFETLFIDTDRLEIIPHMLYSAYQKFISNTEIILPLIIIILFLLFSKKSKDYKIIHNYSLFLFTILFSIGVIILTLIAYVLVFSRYEAIGTASFIRYIAPVSFILWSSIIIATLDLVNNAGFKLVKVSAVTITLVYLTITYQTINKYNFNPNIDEKFIKISSDIVKSFPENEKLFIIDLQTNGSDSVKIRYYVNEFMPIDFFASVHLEGDLNKDIVMKWFNDYKNIHIHSATTSQLKIIKEYVDEFND